MHSETGQTPLARWDDGWQAVGHGPAMASAQALTEAFLWSQWRIVTKTATVSLHANLYQVDELLVGRKVELVFDPFDLTEIEVRYGGRSFGAAVAFTIGRHAHPKARPEQPALAAAPTGIDYLHLIDTAHTEALQRRINYAALTDQPFGGYSEQFTTDQLLPSLLAAAVYFLVNVVLVSVVLALANEERLLPSVVGHLRDEISMTTMLLCVAPVVVLSLQFSLLTAPLCLLPIVAVRQAARAAAASNVQAMHDSLTGLPNRALLLDHLDKALARASRDGSHVALLFFDVDRFKMVNDTRGHDVGDDLLCQIAERIRTVLRPVLEEASRKMELL